MQTCVYCKTNDLSLFTGVEHLIPQSFGTFGTDTPTLDCVCDPCNNLFGRTIDQAFARDSWEGITRYKKGIVSSELRKQSRLKFKIDEEKTAGIFAGAVLNGVDSLNGQILPPSAQFQIFNIKSNTYDVFFKDEVAKIVLTEDTYGRVGERKVKLLAQSNAEYNELANELKKIGIDSTNFEKFHPPFMEGKKEGDEAQVPVFVEGEIDSVIKRAVVKILINFAAKYIGADEVLKPEWDKARDYVRISSEPILGKLSEKPFWGEETDTRRFPSDSFNIIVDNDGANVVGKLQAYNFYTYEFVLAENYNMPGDPGRAACFTKDRAPWFATKLAV